MVMLHLQLLLLQDADDALGSYDPYGTGRYRGIDLNAAAAAANDHDDVMMMPADRVTVPGNMPIHLLAWSQIIVFIHVVMPVSHLC